MNHISVVIPCWNRTTLLRRAIESVCLQTHRPFEIIVVDDGSEDPVYRIVYDFKKKYPFICIRYLFLPQNRGVAVARNEGVCMSQGDYIAFLDSDDQWLPFHLNRLLTYMQQEQLEIIQSDEIWVRSGKRVNKPQTHLKKSGDIFKESLEKCMISPSCVLMKKSLFVKYGGFNSSYRVCEDYELWIRITLIEKIGFLDKQTVVKYGKTHLQLSFSYSAMDQYRIKALLSFIQHNWLVLIEKQCLREVKRVLFNKMRIFKRAALKKNQSICFYRKFRYMYMELIKKL